MKLSGSLSSGELPYYMSCPLVTNSMGTYFKINDMMDTYALAQSLPVSWNLFIETVLRVDHLSNPLPTMIVQMEWQIKNEYCCRTGHKEDDTLHGAQSSYAVTHCNT
jgi:hypothetical protein